MSTSILFTNALLIDGSGRAAVRGANVLVEGQSIKTVSPSPLEVPPEIKRINPLDDVRLFAQPDKVVMVIKEGKVLKDLLASA